MVPADTRADIPGKSTDSIGKRQRQLTEEIRVLKFRLAAMERDRLELTQMTDSLSKSEEKYRALFNSAAYPMTSVNDEGVLLDCNDRIYDILGYERHELLNQSMARIMHPDSLEYAKGNLQELIDTGIAFNKEYRMIRKNGCVIDVCVNSSGIFSPEGEFVRSICILQDISERKRAEKKLSDYQERLKKLVNELSLAEERERRRIAVGIHDNIAQNMAMMKLYLEQVRRDLDPDKDNQTFSDVFACIDRAIDDARHLTFDLGSSTLYISGLEPALVEWLEEEVQAKHGLVTEFEGRDVPDSLDEDLRVLVFRMVRELLVNVVKHAKAQQVKVSVCRTDCGLDVSVRDDGDGFVLGEDSTPSKEGSYGLFSIQERLDCLGGAMDVQSEIGHGTCVTLRVPL